MSAVSKKRVATRRMYYLHNTYLGTHPLFRQDVPKSKLVKFAERVWAEMTAHRPKNYACPLIVYGKGWPVGTGRASYCEGRSRVELVRGQRNKMILLHEIAHALGPVNHGDRFVQVYFDLLSRFTRISRKWLLECAAASGVQYKPKEE